MGFSVLQLVPSAPGATEVYGTCPKDRPKKVIRHRRVNRLTHKVRIFSEVLEMESCAGPTDSSGRASGRHRCGKGFALLVTVVGARDGHSRMETDLGARWWKDFVLQPAKYCWPAHRRRVVVRTRGMCISLAWKDTQETRNHLEE